MSKVYRQACASNTGMTMYNITEVVSVSQGTTIADMPSKRATMGAKANTIMMSFKATCDSVNKPSPCVSRLQTNTIAVQGAAARSINPAI